MPIKATYWKSLAVLHTCVRFHLYPTASNRKTPATKTCRQPAVWCLSRELTLYPRIGTICMFCIIVECYLRTLAPTTVRSPYDPFEPGVGGILRKLATLLASISWLMSIIFLISILYLRGMLTIPSSSSGPGPTIGDGSGRFSDTARRSSRQSRFWLSSKFSRLQRECGCKQTGCYYIRSIHQLNSRKAVTKYAPPTHTDCNSHPSASLRIGLGSLQDA